MGRAPPQHRRSTQMDASSWLTYAMGVVVTVMATANPSWPKWQAVCIAAAVGFCISTSVRDAWWRRELAKAEAV